MIVFPVNNNCRVGKGHKSVPCAVIHDAAGRRIALVPGEPLRSKEEAVKMAFDLCQLLNAGHQMARRCEECRAHIPPHRRDVEIVDFIQYGREVRR